MANYFFNYKEIRNQNIRNSSFLHKKVQQNHYTKHTVVNKGIKVWNNLSEQYKVRSGGQI